MAHSEALGCRVSRETNSEKQKREVRATACFTAVRPRGINSFPARDSNGYGILYPQAYRRILILFGIHRQEFRRS